MEYGSVLELDDLSLYKIPENKTEFRLPFMKDSITYNTVFYQSGRNAIEALLVFLKNEKGIGRLILSDYICSTVKDAAIRAGVEVAEYPLNKNYGFNIKDVEALISNDSVIYINQYFGTPVEDGIISAVKEWQKKGIIVIEDITLSLLSSDKEKLGFGNYILGSLRKWFPIPDGGFLSSVSDSLPKATENDKVSKYTDFYFAVQLMKKKYIDEGCQDKALKDLYLSYYRLSIDELFSDYRIYPISDWSANYLENADFEAIRRIREENYDYLYSLLEGTKGITLPAKRTDNFLPFGMVIKVEERDEILSRLIAKDLYCNVHWRLEFDKNEDAAYLSSHSITVPCDQRYNKKDMEQIAQIIQEVI